MKAGIYIRVSTNEQAEEGYSVGEQTARLKAYCVAKGWTVSEVYTDGGFSGANVERPALNKLMKDVKNKKINAVVVYKLDRLSRSQKDTLFLIEDVFLKNDVNFVSMNENFDTSTPFGRAMIGILSVFAQLEREQITERMQMGLDARAKDGYWSGGGFDPIGYDYVDGKLIINDYEAMQIRKIHDLFLKGTPINRIRNIMSEKYTTKYKSWSSTTAIHNALTNNLYLGLIEWKGNFYKGRHEAILVEEIFERTQKRYKDISWTKGDGKSKKRPFQAKHVLTGLLYCGNCGARYFAKGNYSGRGENRKYRPYYTCYSRAKTAKNMIVDPDCKNKSYAQVDLDKIISDEIKKLSFDPYLIHEIEKVAPDDQVNNETLEKRISEIDEQLSRLLDLYQIGNLSVDTITERVDKLNREKMALVDELEEIETDVPSISKSEAEVLFSGAGDILDHGDLKEKRELVHSLINEIVLKDEQILIHWAFV